MMSDIRKPIAQTLGENVRRIRASRRVTRKQLAEAIKVTIESVAGYEIGKRLAPLDKIFDIANFFNVSIVELTGDTLFTEAREIFEFRLQRATNLAFRLGFSTIQSNNDTILLAPTEQIKDMDVMSIADRAFNFKSSRDFIIFVEDSEEQAITKGIPFEEMFKKALRDRTKL